MESLLEKLNTMSVAKNSVAYKMALDVLNGKKELRPCWTSGSGRYTKNMDHTSSVCTVLKGLEIPFELTNDSKRGGLTGNLIVIKTTFN